MPDVSEDPREIDWHPRFSKSVVGHNDAAALFTKAFAAGRPHHAWLIHGTKGIGKATLAYQLAKQVLGGSAQSQRWVDQRAHPDLFVLERQLNESKPRKLKSEISVDDARDLGTFLARTAAATWRVVLIDSADDLSSESGNAILKLVEEPPTKTMMFLISHQPGRLLRTLKSRCLRLQLNSVSDSDVLNVIKQLPLPDESSREDLEAAILQAGGSVGAALALLHSSGAKAFRQFTTPQNPRLSIQTQIAGQVAAKGQGPDEFRIFGDLLLGHLARAAVIRGSATAAEAYQILSQNLRVAEGFNLDRKQAALEAMRLVTDALKQT